METYQRLKNILFLDIETVCCTPSYDLLDNRLKPLWDKKSMYIDSEVEPAALFEEKGAIYAEFGKIIVISVGRFFLSEDNQLSLRIKAFSGHNEKEVLKAFKCLLEDKYDPKKLLLCAHNGKEFDFPYLCRRMVVNDLILPEVLNLSGKKPWEVNHLDTLEMWKFGDKKHYTSLELLAALFDIPGSKDEMDGSKVGQAYYKEHNLEKIARYCCKDVEVTAQLFLKFNNISPLPEENIHILN